MKFLIVLHKAVMPKSDFQILTRIKVGGSELGVSWIHQMNTRCVITESQKERCRDEDKVLERRNGKREGERERKVLGFVLYFQYQAYEKSEKDKEAENKDTSCCCCWCCCEKGK